MTAGWRLTIWLGLAIGVAVDHAQALDPDEVYAERCSRCHQKQSGDLAQKHLEIVDGELRSRKTKLPLEPFLADHFVQLSEDEMAVLVETLSRQAGGDF